MKKKITAALLAGMLLLTNTGYIYGENFDSEIERITEEEAADLSAIEGFGDIDEMMQEDSSDSEASAELSEIYEMPSEYEGFGDADRMPEIIDDGILVYAGASEIIDEDQYVSKEEAVGLLRDGIENRSTEIKIKYYTYEMVSVDDLGDMVDMALEETDSPVQGDYLTYASAGYSGKIELYSKNEKYLVTMIYTFDFYANVEQEQQVTDKLEQIWKRFSFTEETSDYEKIAAIYDYVCKNVAYDYEGLNDPSNGTKFTAYGSIVEGKSVCQGYAVLIYRMMRMAGISARVITGQTGSGDNHAWNIVRLGGSYYCLDATWDAGEDESRWFLKSENDFPDHMKSEEFETADFMQRYPIAAKSYDASEIPEPTVTPDPTPLPAKISIPQINQIEDQTYTGSELTPAVILRQGNYELVEGQDYTVHYQNNVKPGEASVTVTGLGNYEGESTRLFRILCQHEYGDWKTTKAATVLKKGSRVRRCTICDSTETRSIAKLKPFLKVSAKTVTLQAKQSTTTLKVTDMAKGDSVKEWRSSDSGIVKVSGKSNGTCKLTAGNRTGNAKITILLRSGKKATVTIKVQKASVATTGISGISKSVTLKKGKSVTLKPVIAPVTSQDKVTYVSSDPKVASVNAKGKIVAKKKGTAEITVKSGKKHAKCVIKVK